MISILFLKLRSIDTALISPDISLYTVKIFCWSDPYIEMAISKPKLSKITTVEGSSIIQSQSDTQI